MNRFRKYLLLQATAVLGVTIVFAILPDKKMASVLASLMFIFSSFVVLGSEKFLVKTTRSGLAFWATAIFLVFFILPIVILRLAFWESSFEQISFAGLSARGLHQYSNFAFMVMLVTYYIESLRHNKKGPKTGA